MRPTDKFNQTLGDVRRLFKVLDQSDGLFQEDIDRSIASTSTSTLWSASSLLRDSMPRVDRILKDFSRPLPDKHWPDTPSPWASAAWFGLGNGLKGPTHSPRHVPTLNTTYERQSTEEVALALPCFPAGHVLHAVDFCNASAKACGPTAIHMLSRLSKLALPTLVLGSRCYGTRRVGARYFSIRQPVRGSFSTSSSSEGVRPPEFLLGTRHAWAPGGPGACSRGGRQCSASLCSMKGFRKRSSVLPGELLRSVNTTLDAHAHDFLE